MATATTSTSKAPRIVTIQTERLQLTTLQVSDLDGMFPLISAPAVMQWTPFKAMSDRAEAENWLTERALRPDGFLFCIRTAAHAISAEVGSTVVGVVGSFRRPTCGYLIHPDHAGKGYATEALKAFIPRYFEHVPSTDSDVTGSDYLEAWTDTGNLASQRVLAKCGFVTNQQTKRDYDNPTLGSRTSLVWYLPRPGKTVEQLKLLPLGVDVSKPRIG